MVLKLDGNSEHIACVFDINGCLESLKYPRSLHTCAPISESPSNISTLKGIHFQEKYFLAFKFKFSASLKVCTN